jgi:serine/threonine-protein kinase
LRGGPLPLTQALELGADLAVVVGQLHAAGIVHCDIKPSNIGFSQTGVVKLVDFGVAHMLRSAASVVTSAPTETGDAATGLSALVTGHRLFGTPAYMSPEAALGAPPSPGWDLWSLSAVLFESFAGSRPFDVGSAADLVLQVSRRSGRAIRELRPDCPEEVASFFEAALSADPARRPRDAADLKRRLSALQLSLT